MNALGGRGDGSPKSIAYPNPSPAKPNFKPTGSFRRIGSIAFDIARRHVAHVALVADDDIVRSQRALWSELRVLAEPGGAAAMAALLCGAYRPARGERVGVIVCGGNTDPALFTSTD